MLGGFGRVKRKLAGLIFTANFLFPQATRDKGAFDTDVATIPSGLIDDVTRSGTLRPGPAPNTRGFFNSERLAEIMEAQRRQLRDFDDNVSDPGSDSRNYFSLILLHKLFPWVT